MPPVKQLRMLNTAPTRFVLAALPLLLEFLNAQEVARIVCTQQSVGREGCAAIWYWLVTRTRSILPTLKLPSPAQVSETIQVASVLPLLRQVHAAATYNFDLRFDAVRHGSDVYLIENEDCYVSRWGPKGGSMFGDRVCAPGAVSYWECMGLSEGCYVGVTELVTPGQVGFQYYGVNAHHLKRTLSLPTAACDNMPAVMYCEAGFITTGSFRGPKPQLPTKTNFLATDTFQEADRIGVFVDLLAGFILFLCNGKPQALRIPIDRFKTYVPVFSAYACYNLRLLRAVCPPWHTIYNADDHRTR
ncbi:hypothetical protein PsorP6_005504 [Peronosclerospora sorghi]|uniref:Uncharacterized protein n=1 Tax=Peronosclerospora sorghi TaxID=230839 RepID=A0ACC0W8F7_9STRA|nr:hypothetical protein PsorP6_005504 [Peronosclerospora sorghi]